MKRFLPAGSASRSKLLLLGVILVIALVLRAWGIGFGLPFIYHFDEHFYVNTALKLGAGILHNPPYAPVGFSNILVGVYGAYFVFGRLIGLFDSAQAFEAAFRLDPSTFYVLGRLATAILGAIAVLALYPLGRILANTRTGLLAAGLLAVSFLHVRDSHYAVPDVAMGTFVVITVLFAVWGLREQARKHVYLAAFMGGLATAMKWTGLPVALVIWLGSAWVTDRNEIGSFAFSRWFGWPVILAGILFVLGFFVGSPQIAINPMLYFNEAIGQFGAGSSGGFELWQVDTLPGWLFYLKMLFFGLGPVLLAVGVVGLFHLISQAVKAQDRVAVLVLAFPVVYYLLMGSTRHYFVRYAVPMIPFLVLFAAFSLDWMIAQVGQRWKRFKPIFVGSILVIVTLQPFLLSVRHNMILTRQDTRTTAKQFIEAEIPAGAKIAVDWETHGPPLSSPEKVYPRSEQLYEIDKIGESGLSEHSLDWYRDQGYDYLIATSNIYEIPLVDEASQAERERFYKSLDQELVLLQEFRPNPGDQQPPFVFDEIYGPLVGLWNRERPGPTIKLYELNEAGDSSSVLTSETQ